MGLSLSLFVLLDRQISDMRFRSLAVFFMGAQALLTLVIQGTTMPWLLQARSPNRCQGLTPVISGSTVPWRLQA